MNASLIPDSVDTVYIIFDRKTSTCGDLLCLPNVQVAVRTFVIGMKDSRLQMHHFPDDFELRRLGEFNRNTGVFSPVPHSAGYEVIMSGRDAYNHAHPKKEEK